LSGNNYLGGPSVRPVMAPRGFCGEFPVNGLVDEITPIARYMAQEMNKNIRSETAKAIRYHNAYGLENYADDFTKNDLLTQIWNAPVLVPDLAGRLAMHRVMALKIWVDIVKTGAPWDHKGYIRTHFGCGGVQKVWHRYGPVSYFYDVWSNIHFGYVGFAVGFSEDTLLDGAGAQQLWTNVKKAIKEKKLPELKIEEFSPRTFDAPEDRAAITMGVKLFKQRPSQVDASDLVRLVTNSNMISRRLADFP
jgi:Bacterial toxin 44